MAVPGNIEAQSSSSGFGEAPYISHAYICKIKVHQISGSQGSPVQV